jgi:hypothetical protein
LPGKDHECLWLAAWKALGGVARGAEIVQAWWHGQGEIVNVCGSPAWQALRAHSVDIMWVWEVGVWGSMALARLRSRAGGLEIPWHVEQQLCGPMGQGLVCSTVCSFSILWCGEAFHELGVQSAYVSALPGALPQSYVSPPSQQSQRSGGLWLCPSHHLGFL